jgi:hypothetical protein
MNKTLRSTTLGKFVTIASAGLILVSASASADTLDFSGLSIGAQGSTVLVLPNATITSFGSDIYVGAAGIDHEICALTGGGNCEADLRVDFSTAVNSLSFVTSGWHSGDHIDVNVYSGASLLGTVGHSSNGLVDLSAFSLVTSIYLDDSSIGGAGMAYDHFIFAPVPEPETYAMLLAGLGLLGFMARRRKESAV